MESGTRSAPGEAATSSGSNGVKWTGVGIATLVLMFAVGLAIVHVRRRHDRLSPA
jgi:hypothetical protein